MNGQGMAPQEPINGRVLRIALIGDLGDNVRRYVRWLASRLRANDLNDEQRATVADMLDRLSTDRPTASFSGGRDYPREPDRTGLVALDCLLRRVLDPKAQKIEAAVATDWAEKSAETVRKIASRERDVAQVVFDRYLSEERARPEFDLQVSIELVANAIAAARYELQTGEQLAFVNRRDRPLQLDYFFGHMMSFHERHGGALGILPN